MMGALAARLGTSLLIRRVSVIAEIRMMNNIEYRINMARGEWLIRRGFLSSRGC